MLSGTSDFRFELASTFGQQLVVTVEALDPEHH